MIVTKILMSCLFCLVTVYGLGQELCRYISNEKRCFDISASEVIVKSTMQNVDDLKNVLQNTALGEIKKIGYLSVGNVFMVEMQNANKDNILEALRLFTSTEEILSLSPIFLEHGQIMDGYTDEVLVMLKSNDDYPVLQKYAESYQIKDIELMEYYALLYKLTLSYNSKKNALQVANELHETGLFTYVEPNYIIFLQLGDNNPYYPNEDIPFSIYPNPANDILQVDITDNSACEISIYSLQGAKALQTLATGNKTQIDVSTLPDGIYFLQLYESVTGKQGMKKIVIKH